LQIAGHRRTVSTPLISRPAAVVGRPVAMTPTASPMPSYRSVPARSPVVPVPTLVASKGPLVAASLHSPHSSPRPSLPQLPVPNGHNGIVYQAQAPAQHLVPPRPVRQIVQAQATSSLRPSAAVAARPVNVSVVGQGPAIPVSPKLGALASAVQKEAEPAASLYDEEGMIDMVLTSRGYKIARDQQFNPKLPAGALGKGAFGLVYKASRNDVHYAVKKFDNASKWGEMITKEAEVLKLLDHPAIVRLVDCFLYTAKDWMFITMDFADGGDLLDALVGRPHLFVEAFTRAVLFHI